MLRAGAYFPPSRNGRSWSPSAAAPGHQERLALVIGIVPYTFTPPPLLHPLRYARPPDMGTVTLKTLPLEGGVPVRGRGYLSIREVLHPPLLHPLRFARPPDMGTVMDTTSLKLGDSYERCYNSSPGRGGVRRTEG